MEIIIILIVIGIISYVIYQSLPDTKFKKAEELYNSEKLNEAIEILISIFDKHKEAPIKLAECKFQQGVNAKLKSENDAIKLLNEAIEIKKRLPEKVNRKLYELIEAKSFFEIAQINFNRISFVSGSESKIKKINENLDYIESATKTGIEDDFIQLKKKHLSNIAEINFGYGVQSEKAGRMVEAMTYYSTSKKTGKEAAYPKIIYDSITRTGICKLKIGEIIDFDIISDVNKSSPEYKKDFFYRFAKMLLQEKKYSETESLILNQLNFQSPKVSQLKEILKIKKIEDAVVLVNEINLKLDNLYENSFPIDDVKTFYEELDEKTNSIKTVIPALTDKLTQLKPSLFNRLLSHYISEEQYGNAIVLIQKFPSFWESPELLKNLGICCYGYAAQGRLSEKNYKIIVSNWLTAVFCDNVILKSIEETSWDDEYTFTIKEVVGSKHWLHDNLPDNVNYEDTSETNISIGATQLELLQQFETLLQHKISDNLFAKKANDFYLQEKNAILRVTTLLNSDTFFATPYFAKTHGINNGIIEELEGYYDEFFDEEALEAGMPYVKDQTGGSVSKYREAKELIIRFLDAVLSEDLNAVRLIIKDNSKSLFDEFQSIKDAFEDQIYNAVALKIKKNKDKESLIPIMNECIQFATQNEKLKFQYSNFVADFCIDKVNDDKMDNFTALGFMKNAYLYSKDSVKICKNIVTLIRFNLMDIINERTTKEQEIYKILDIIKKGRSTTFKKNANELSKARRDILKQLADSGVDVSDFLSTFSIYLNPSGEKIKKVLGYMNVLSED